MRWEYKVVGKPYRNYLANETDEQLCMRRQILLNECGAEHWELMNADAVAFGDYVFKRELKDGV